MNQLDNKTVALLKSIFAKDQDGNLYIRMIATSPEDLELSNAVNTQSNQSLSTLLSQAIVLDEDNNPALRVVGVSFGQDRLAYEKEQTVKAAEEIKAIKAKAVEASVKKVEKTSEK